jgi:hypothetical protein
VRQPPQPEPSPFVTRHPAAVHRAPRASPQALAAIAAALLVLGGCTTVGGPVMPLGSRQIAIPVNNHSNAPAALAVTNDNPQAKSLVGSAQPSSVPPQTTQEVVFTLPDNDMWAIEVNGQTLIIPMDVAGHTGRLPITIEVGPDGSIGWSSPGNWP